MIATKISKVIGVLNKIKSILPNATLLTIYKTIILPNISYAITMWGCANSSSLNRIHILQKKALRICCKVHYLHHSTPLFISNQLLNIFDIYLKETAIFMYKYHSNLLPTFFNTLFHTHESVHEHNTRNKSNLSPNFKRTKMGQKSISFHGTKIWNNLSNCLKSSSSLSIFKHNLHSRKHETNLNEFFKL